MKKTIIFNTSFGSQNLGDYIINDLAEISFRELIKDDFVVEFGTHTPVLHSYQTTKFKKNNKIFMEADNKFVIGTNLIKKNMMIPWADWNVNIFNCKPYKNAVLAAVGLDNNSKKTNIYTTMLYKKILNKNLVHSTRDEKTKLFLESMGFKAVNTGCVTLWNLDKEKCKKIPTKKSNKVIFTLTDYAKDLINDQKLIDILNKNYEEVYFWIQGTDDLEYFNQFKNIENIKLVGPSLSAYKSFLEQNEADFVGTRLHAGIFAMHYNKRTIILIVDNRARDMKETYNLNTLERTQIDELEGMIKSTIKTNIKIDMEKINKWKSQFK